MNISSKLSHVQRILTSVLAIIAIVNVFRIGTAYSVYLRWEYLLFDTTPAKSPSLMWINAMIAVAFFAAIIFKIAALVLETGFMRDGKPSASAPMTDLGSDLIITVIGASYIPSVYYIAKGVPAIDWTFIVYLALLGISLLSFIIKIATYKKRREKIEIENHRYKSDRNAKILTFGFIILPLILLGVSFIGFKKSSDVFGIYGRESKRNKSIEKDYSNQFYGAVSLDGKIYFADTVVNMYDPSICSVDKDGNVAVLDNNHCVTNDGFICCSGRNLYYLSREFKNWESDAFIVQLNVDTRQAKELKFPDASLVYKMSDNFIAVKDNYLYFGMEDSNSHLDVWRVKISDNIDLGKAERFADDVYYDGNFAAYYEALIHGTGRIDSSVRYSGSKVITLGTEKSAGFESLDEKMQQVIGLIHTSHCNTLYVSSSDEAYDEEYKTNAYNGTDFVNHHTGAKVIADNVNTYNVYGNKIYYSVVTPTGTEIWVCNNDGSDKKQLASYDDYIVCSRIYVTDSYIGCYVSNNFYYQLFDFVNASSKVEKIDTIKVG